MKLYVSLVLNLALLMVNGSTGWGPVVHRMEVRQDRPEAEKDQGADILEFGFENALRVFLVETQKCMVSEDPQGCELEKAQTLCWDIAEHVPEQEQGGDPCACFDTSESVAEALTCVGADFNDFCSDHQDAQRCKTPALWLLTGVIAGLNDLGVPTETAEDRYGYGYGY